MTGSCFWRTERSLEIYDIRSCWRIGLEKRSGYATNPETVSRFADVMERKSNLGVDSKVNHVSVLNDVFLTFDSKFSFFLYFGLGSGSV